MISGETTALQCKHHTHSPAARLERDAGAGSCPPSGCCVRTPDVCLKKTRPKKKHQNHHIAPRVLYWDPTAMTSGETTAQQGKHHTQSPAACSERVPAHAAARLGQSPDGGKPCCCLQVYTRQTRPRQLWTRPAAAPRASHSLPIIPTTPPRAAPPNVSVLHELDTTYAVSNSARAYSYTLDIFQNEQSFKQRHHYAQHRRRARAQRQRVRPVRHRRRKPAQ